MYKLKNATYSKRGIHDVTCFTMSQIQNVAYYFQYQNSYIHNIIFTITNSHLHNFVQETFETLCEF